MPYIQINEVSRSEDVPNALYLDVSVWRDQADFDAGKPYTLRNDFIMQVPKSIVTRAADGWLKRTDGVFVDPQKVTDKDTAIGFERAYVAADVRAQVRSNIRDYLRRAAAKRYSGDHRIGSTESFKVDGVVRRKTFKVLRRVKDASDILASASAMEGAREAS